MTTDERLEWLRERQKGLGGTDIACICGIGFRTPTEVYAEKTAAEVIDFAGTPLMRLGLQTEALNAQLYSERTGAPLMGPGLYRSLAHPWCFATLDRVRPGDPIGYPVELKYTPFFGDEWGPDGSDEVRDTYLIQATWQGLVLRQDAHNVERTDLSALAGTGEHRIYQIAFDAALAELLLATASEFWERVESRTGVAGWSAPLAREIERRLAEIHPDTSVPLGPECVELVDRYVEYKDHERIAKTNAEWMRGAIIDKLGTAETGTLPDGRRVQQKTVHRDAYTVEAGTYVRLSVLKHKKEKRAS